MLGRKISFITFKRSLIIQCMFGDHTVMKLEIKAKKISGKSSNIHKQNTSKEFIGQGKIIKYLELNENVTACQNW